MRPFPSLDTERLLLRAFTRDDAPAVQTLAGDYDVARIQAHHMATNPASGRVLQKVGMRQEGCLGQAFERSGVAEDIVWYAVFADEWNPRCQGGDGC